jgi:hypothetical protein
MVRAVMARGTMRGCMREGGLLLALLALVCQLAVGAVVPPASAATVPICHAPGSAVPPVGHAPDCALCPLCVALAMPAPVPVPGALPPLPRLARADRPEGVVFVAGRPAAPTPARARGPPGSA